MFQDKYLIKLDIILLERSNYDCSTLDYLRVISINPEGNE